MTNINIVSELSATEIIHYIHMHFRGLGHSVSFVANHKRLTLSVVLSEHNPDHGLDATALQEKHKMRAFISGRKYGGRGSKR